MKRNVFLTSEQALRQAYGRFGEAMEGEEAWRTDPPGFERTAPNAVRYPIMARLEKRRSWLRRLNGWLQIGIFAAAGALVFGLGFIAGAVWMNA